MNLMEMYNKSKEERAEYFYFYVEKYDKKNRELLLDLSDELVIRLKIQF